MTGIDSTFEKTSSDSTYTSPVSRPMRGEEPGCRRVPSPETASAHRPAKVLAAPTPGWYSSSASLAPAERASQRK